MNSVPACQGAATVRFTPAGSTMSSRPSTARSQRREQASAQPSTHPGRAARRRALPRAMLTGQSDLRARRESDGLAVGGVSGNRRRSSVRARRRLSCPPEHRSRLSRSSRRPTTHHDRCFLPRQQPASRTAIAGGRTGGFRTSESLAGNSCAIGVGSTRPRLPAAEVVDCLGRRIAHRTSAS